ncbi:HD domain-containing protein [Clostridium sp.]|uniref:HD domain-containing protein n=1 Tax=Clostridium sp. TaxID=1506 RepID=UPI002607E352|nr:HD domain-containing protein [Clostridium sp.]
MDRVNKILNNERYKKLLDEISEFEQDRIFCKHSLAHFLDVARISYIEVLEKQLNHHKEVIYAISLLHDIGRVLEYKEGIPHNIASAMIAEDILKGIGFTEEEENQIIKSIKEHRLKSEDSLSEIIYKSDKLSRNCFNCKSTKLCKWNDEKKNKGIEI